MSLDQILLLPSGYGFDASNAAPTITVPGAQSAVSNVALAITGTSIADADSNPQTVTLTVSHGTLTLASTTGISFSVGDGTADATMTFSGSLANVNTAIATLTYTATAYYSGSDTLAISIDDGAGGIDSDSIAITVASELLTGLIAYYKFDESSGVATDSLATYDLTDNNSCGTAAGKISTARTTVIASSQSLSATISSNRNGKSWCVGFWHYVDALPAAGYAYAMSAIGTGDVGIVIRYVNSGATEITYWSGGAFASQSGGILAAGNWYYFAAGHNAATGKFFSSRNGAAITETTVATVSSQATWGLRFGASGTPDQYSTGRCDEAGVWVDRLITQSDITQLYNSGNGVTHPTFA